MWLDGVSFDISCRLNNWRKTHLIFIIGDVKFQVSMIENIFSWYFRPKYTLVGLRLPTTPTTLKSCAYLGPKLNNLQGEIYTFDFQNIQRIFSSHQLRPSHWHISIYLFVFIFQMTATNFAPISVCFLDNKEFIKIAYLAGI